MDRDERTYAIIGAAMFVHNELGVGYLERTYQDALEIVFAARGIPFRREVPIDIWFLGKRLDGTFRADFQCHDDILLELKAIPALGRAEVSQLAHYLTATGKPLGLLINFGGERLEFQRVLPRKSRHAGPTWVTQEIREIAEAEAHDLEISDLSALSQAPHTGSG